MEDEDIKKLKKAIELISEVIADMMEAACEPGNYDDSASLGSNAGELMATNLILRNFLPKENK